jgi:superfamily II DNA or RNA helicase
MLRPYQQTAITDIKKSYLSGKRAPLFVLSTGGGKTFIFSHIAKNASNKGKRVLILVHRVELLRQTSGSLNFLDVPHGLINPKYTPDREAMVQVASVQTLVRRLDKIIPPDMIIIDECHHATAGSWDKIVSYFPNAKILGVTATPCRGDGKGLGVIAGGLFDDLICGPQTPELIDMGFLVKPKVYAPKNNLDFSEVHTRMGDYDKKEIGDLMDRPTITGDAVSHYKRLCSGVPAVAFCVSIKHAEHVAQQFMMAGYRAYAVSGETDDDERDRLLAGLGNGTVDLIASCDLISEGTDIPAIGCAILLRPTQSLGLYIQQVGRALRPSEGKNQAIILDHVGNVLNHGMPDDERTWTLEGKKRRRGPKTEEPTVLVTQCSECFSVYKPAPICPECGHKTKKNEREPEQVDGELEEIKREQIKKEKKIQNYQAGSYAELQELARQRGYKPGWAKNYHENRRLK